MPRYDYKCVSCRWVFEVKQSFASEPVATCPSCQSTARRVIHAVPVVFKGSGFYVNDYGSKGGSSSSHAKATEAESKSEPKSESKKETTSKSKGESKKEPASKK